MNIHVFDTEIEMGSAAASHAATCIREAIQERDHINIVIATGTSQFELFKHLIKEPNIDWSRVTLFHLDEYIDLAETHPASFRKYIKDRFLRQVSSLEACHFIQGDAVDPKEECNRLSAIIQHLQIDVALVGIGENGHLAFNDPPADFETTVPFIIVNLDEACRQQQLGEGWFHSLEDVPNQAITMSIQQILKAKAIVCTVPGGQKAHAIESTLKGEVRSNVPASILRQHRNVSLFLDVHSAQNLQSN